MFCAGTNVTTLTRYNGLGWRLETVNGRDKPTWYGYDKLGRTTVMTDALGHTTRTGYDGLGHRRSQTNGEDETTTFTYDGANRLLSVENNLGHLTQYRYNKADERIVMIDAEDVETHYAYDALGRLTGVIENFDDGLFEVTITDQDVETEYGYDRVGNRTVLTDATYLASGGAEGAVTTFIYLLLTQGASLASPTSLDMPFALLRASRYYEKSF